MAGSETKTLEFFRVPLPLKTKTKTLDFFLWIGGVDYSFQGNPKDNGSEGSEGLPNDV